MKTIRLLPIVVMAASALLALKTIGLVTGGGYTLSGVPLAMAQDEAEVIGESPVRDALDFGHAGEEFEAAEAAAQALFDEQPVAAGGTDETVLYEFDGQGEPIPLEAEPTTRSVIQERLTQRRAELDALETELDTRLALVEAAERRIDERMAELGQIEDRINAMVDAQEGQEAEQFARLISMYENMRPAEAATIFDDLDIGILVRVGETMNPRRLGPIIARMSPEKAQELTVHMARQDAGIDPTPAPSGDLPQIVGQ